MKKLIATLLLFSATAHASCDWKTGITPGPNKTFIYSEECHQEVGKIVQANRDLTSAIQLKDLAIKDSDARVALWQKSADDSLSRLSTIQSDQKRSDWLYFALGSLTVIGAGLVVAKISGR